MFVSSPHVHSTRNRENRQVAGKDTVTIKQPRLITLGVVASDGQSLAPNALVIASRWRYGELGERGYTKVISAQA